MVSSGQLCRLHLKNLKHRKLSTSRENYAKKTTSKTMRKREWQGRRIRLTEYTLPKLYFPKQSSNRIVIHKSEEIIGTPVQ